MSHFTPASLRRAAGHDMFYSIVAELDPTNAVAWLEMVSVQADFGAGEADYDQPTRTYSESMRLTLHYSLILTFESTALLREATRSSGGLYGYFIRLHPTAFKANGACTMNPRGMAEVMFNTRSSMMSAQNIGWIMQGLSQRYNIAVRAATYVRNQRRSKKLPVTVDGYREPQRVGSLERLMSRHRRGRGTHNAMAH
ncbi:MAG: hypothetical protein ACRBN8_34595 [Nannocystales bacterium]